jgi:hypothetical protein
MRDAIPQPLARKKSRRRSFIGTFTYMAGSRIALSNSMVTRFRAQDKSSLGALTNRVDPAVERTFLLLSL